MNRHVIDKPAYTSPIMVSKWLADHPQSAQLGFDSIVRFIKLRTRTRSENQVAGETHPSTAHYFCKVSKDSRAYCVKLLDVSSEAAQAFFKREVDALRVLGDVSNDGRTALSPKLYIADARTGVIVMDWLDGNSLKHQLRRNMFLLRDSGELLAGAGVWLRRYHMTYGIEIKPAPAMQMLSDLEERLAGLPSHAREELYGDERFLKALAHVRDHALALDGKDVEWSLHHQDFTPSNLIFDPHTMRMGGVDFGYSTLSQPVAIDLARFSLRAADVTTFYYLQTAKVAATFESVRRGYNNSWSADEIAWMGWCVSRLIVQQLMFFVGQNKSPYPLSVRGIAYLARRYRAWRRAAGWAAIALR